MGTTQKGVQKKGFFPIIFERFKTVAGYVGRSRHQRGEAKDRSGAYRRPHDYYEKKKSRRKMARESRRRNRS